MMCYLFKVILCQEVRESHSYLHFSLDVSWKDFFYDPIEYEKIFIQINLTH